MNTQEKKEPSKVTLFSQVVCHLIPHEKVTKLYVHTNEIPYGTAFGTLRARFSSLWPPRLLEAILQKLMNYKNFNF